MSAPVESAAGTVLELLERGAERAPGDAALVGLEDAAASYADLLESVAGVRSALHGAGIGPSDTVALVVDNGPVAAAAFLGISCTAACAPLNPAYRESEIAFYLEDLGARLVVVQAGLEDAIAGPASRLGTRLVRLEPREGAAGAFALEGLSASVPDGPRPTPDDVALVLHTSGTTARPKMVPLRHRNLTWSAASVAATLELRASDRCLNVMPLFHIHGLVAALLASLHAGGSVACAPSFQAPRFLDWLRQLEPTWYTAVPTMHQAVLARLTDAPAAGRGHRLRFARSSSAALPVPVLEGLEAALGVPVVEAYGMTEAAHQMASNPLPPGVRVPGSVGRPAGPEIAILDEAGLELAAGEVGEVAIRGPNVFAGYAANPEANEDAFANGWFRTGDEGVLDERGYLHLRGRLKEIINRGGEKIAPAEVDDVLLRHPAVAQAVTFGMPDPRLGEEVAAAVVLRDGSPVAERDLQDFVALTVAPFKVPRRIVLVEEIPKGPTGKLQRLQLAERLGLDEAAAETDESIRTLPLTALERAVGAVFADVLELPSVAVNDDFFALGGDSILGTEAIGRLRDLTGQPDFPVVALVRAPTAARLAAELASPHELDSIVVPLAEGTASPPVFIAHGGDVIGLPAVARRLAGNRPVFALRPAGLDGSVELAGSVEEIAESFLGEVTRLQPEGPVFLVGVCSGGPMMLELAHRLAGRGREVAAVVLVDPRTRLERTFRYLVWRAWRHARDGTFVRAVSLKLRLLAGRPVDRTDGPKSDVYRALAGIRDTYVPRPLPGVPGVAIVTEDYEQELSMPPWIWKNALPAGVELRRVTGRHYRLLEHPPTADAVAAEIQRALDAIGR